MFAWLSEVRCRFAYGPADATATHLSLAQVDSAWQWNQLGHMQICTSPQTHNHASIPPLSILQARCPSCHPTNSVKALKEVSKQMIYTARKLTNESACTTDLETAILISAY